MSESITYWLEALQDRYFVARVTAARVLGATGHKIPDAVPALIQALQDREAGVRDVAAEALGALGRAAQPAVPALLATLNDRNKFVRNAARKALQQIDPALALPAGPAAVRAVLRLAPSLGRRPREGRGRCGQRLDTPSGGHHHESQAATEVSRHPPLPAAQPRRGALGP